MTRPPVITTVRTGVAQEVIRQEDTIRERTRQAFLARRRAATRQGTPRDAAAR